MKLGMCIFKHARFTTDLTGDTELCLLILPGYRHAARQLAKKISGLPEKLYTFTVSEGVGHRTLRQNALLWAVCAEMAGKSGQNTEPEDVYRRILDKYGVHETLIVPLDAVQRLPNVFKSVEVSGVTHVDGAEMARVRCTYGSSAYDAAQMSALIEGLLAEAADCEVNTAEMQYLDCELIRNEK